MWLMACFQPDTRAPSTSLLAVAEARLPCLALFKARLSSILQIINHSVFSADGQVRWSGVSVLSESVDRGTVSGSVLGSGSGLMLVH